MKHVCIIGTCDTKHTEILYVRNLLHRLGIRTCIVDVGVFEQALPPDAGQVVPLRERRPDVFSSIADRGRALALMGTLLEDFLAEQQNTISGVMGLGGSGNTAVVTRGMRLLPIGLPKLMVSTVASGDVAPYVGASDICMMPSVADVQGLNVMTRKILGNAAHALAGMVQHPCPDEKDGRTLVGMSMFGVTTPCVQQVCALLPDNYEPLVFHATGTGGRSLEKLVDSGMARLVIDLTLTEICDLFMGGVMSAGDDRLGAIIRTGIPYVGSVGALDMVNFAAMPTVPEKYRERTLFVHNENVTLMRTTAEENAAMGKWIGERLNRCSGKVRFLLPEGGVSAIDAPGMPFHDPQADAALFDAIEASVIRTGDRQVIRVPHHINAPAFAETVRDHFLAIQG